VAKIDPGRYSKAERAIINLTPEEEARRRAALEFCAAEAAS
jgi:hypothetical protein